MADPQLTRNFRVLYPTLGQLEAAYDAATALVSSPGWPVLCDLVGAEVAQIDARLDSGVLLESRAEYASRHGRRGGLRATLQFIPALIEYAEAELEQQRARHEGAADAGPGGSG